jgi:hypothetical protein
MLLIHPAHELLSGEAADAETLFGGGVETLFGRGGSETLLSGGVGRGSSAAGLLRRPNAGCAVCHVVSVVAHSTVATTAITVRRREGMPPAPDVGCGMTSTV